MKTRNLIILLVLSALLLNFNGIKSQTANTTLPELKWAKDVGAKTMPLQEKIYNVSAFGAKNDGKTLNTSSIQAAIEACAVNGGGIVAFDTGAYLTGSIFLKKRVHLRIDKGVEIRGSQNLSDYPEIDTRIAGIEMKWPAALINVLDQDNVAITGEGIIHAQGKPFWDKYWQMRQEYDKKGLRWVIDYDCKRPRTFLVSGSTNVTLKSFTIKQAGFWSIQILFSQYVTVNGIVIRNNIDGKGPSTDGIDIDSSSFILVENCDIDCNDDNFCLKAGRDADGLRVNRPTEYVVIRNCIARAGGGVIVCGSETSGSIRHILAYHLKAEGSGSGIRLKSAITRGGTVEDIYIQDVEMNGVKNAINITMNWNPSYSYSTLPKEYNYDSIPVHWKTLLQKVSEEQGLPYFKNINISSIKGTNAGQALNASGMEKSLMENFNLKNIDIEAKTAGKISYAKGWKFENVTIKAKDNSKLEMENCSDMSL
jgi:polygalacturonase